MVMKTTSLPPGDLHAALRRSSGPPEVQVPPLNFPSEPSEAQALYSTADRLPVGGVPGQEPAGEGWWFMTLFDHHHWSLLVPPTRVALNVLFGCRDETERSWF